jgi:prepilin-type N-terminal cleavage/methylation domain-containing protein
MEMVSLMADNAFSWNGAMDRRRKGFTLIEVIIVLVIGAILMSMAIKGFGSTASLTSARQARNVFNGMVARARAQAIESGRSTVLIADALGDSVLIMANGRIVENVRFGEEMGIDIQASQDMTRLCMNPRGYADQDCNSFNTTVKMSFVQGNQSKSLEILPLGQIRW